MNTNRASGRRAAFNRGKSDTLGKGGDQGGRSRMDSRSADNQKAMESPDNLQMSLAAAMTLGLRPGIFYRGAKLCCINLLLTYENGCAGSCAYCGLQRQRGGRFRDRSFIRVEWPTFSTREILQRTSSRLDQIDRVCISMVTNRKAVGDTLEIASRLRSLETSISVLMAPTVLDLDGIAALKDAGVEIGSVAVDLATEDLFDRFRGRGVRGPHQWERYWECLGEAVDVFGERKAGCHLIVGLGETEAEMTSTMQRVHDMGANVHLFSFYPEEGSALEDRDPCGAGRFRRMQLASYLIGNGQTRYESLEFDQAGNLSNFGIDNAEQEIVIGSGIPFMTSGCPGKDKLTACTRPYGDGPPGDIRSYPFMPNMEDIAKIRLEMGESK
jgi:biotin synthase-related radical SAM superfamily protein